MSAPHHEPRPLPAAPSGRRLVLVAALARNRVIGADGTIPWHLPEDLAHFKQVTMGRPMIMGRRTYDSIGRPLPGRRTIVVTRNGDWSRDGVERAGDVDTALDLAGDGDVMIVGGEQVYAQTIDRAHVLDLTYVDAEPEGDTFFPLIDATWHEVSRVERDGFTWARLERRGDPTP